MVSCAFHDASRDQVLTFSGIEPSTGMLPRPNELKLAEQLVAIDRSRLRSRALAKRVSATVA